jgi:hypothetical protein
MIIILSGECHPSDLAAAKIGQTQGAIALYNRLVLGHTKNKGVQRIYCNPFPAKPFYGSHRLDIVMIRPPGIDHGAFVVSPSTVWYARILLLFLPLLQQTLDPSPSNALLCRRWRHTMILRMVIICIMYIIYIICFISIIFIM